MPTSLPATGSESGSGAWQELEDVLAALGQLARSPIEPEQFYERALGESIRALSAAGGAAWLRSATGTLRLVASVNWNPDSAAAGGNPRETHETLLKAVANEGRVTTSSSGAIIAAVQLECDEPGRAEAPVTAALLEVMPRAGASPATYRGYEQFLTAVCDIAAEYHAHRELRRLRSDEHYREQLVELSKQVHQGLELTRTAYAVANEGRRVIGCDRLSVLQVDGRSSRLLATSGASHVERRGAAAHELEQLAKLVEPTAEAAWYADGQCDALPPIANAMEAYAEESHARHIAVVPLAALAQEEAESPRGSSRRATSTFVLIAEQFDARREKIVPQQVIEVGALCATALSNAQAVEELPLRWLLRPMADARRKILENLSRSMAIGLGTMAALAALVVIPAEFAVEATGTLEPAVRQEVFAPRSGLVDEVLIAQGADVAAGQPLLKLRDAELDLNLQRARGEMETVSRQLEAARATKTSREVRDESPIELYRISANEREFEQQLRNLELELQLLEAERDKLVVRSPIAGRVLTWDLAGRLAARPVERGEALVTIGDLSADWQLELAVADDRIGQVLSAQEAAGEEPLDVRFRLRSADTPYDGHVHQIGLTASVDESNTSNPRPTVEVVVAFDKSQLDPAAQRELRPGVSARAEIDCGWRSLGYVWFHDLWDAAITWLRF